MPASLPRLAFDQFEPALAAMLEPRVRRLGYLGEFFQCCAHQPAALRSFLDFTEATHAAVPQRLVELVALTVSGRMGNAYERNQHERLCVRLGIAREWVAAVNALQPDGSPGLTEAERRVQHLTLAALGLPGGSAGEAFEACLQHFGPAQAVAILMLIARYAAHGLMVGVLQLAPPVPSIFEDGFSG